MLFTRKNFSAKRSINRPVRHNLPIITFYYTKRLLTKQGVFCVPI